MPEAKLHRSAERATPQLTSNWKEEALAEDIAGDRGWKEPTRSHVRHEDTIEELARRELLPHTSSAPHCL